MRAIVVGLGVQGYKRRKFAGTDYIASVDPINTEADYKRIEDVRLEEYDAALCCIPDEPKLEILEYFLTKGKHVLVEKPLWVPKADCIDYLERIACNKGVVCYTAYNHRFEPHIVKMRQLITSGVLGKIYSCRMFYGNGTSKLVRDSIWRDQGAGVLLDLGSHLLDICLFWFGDIAYNFALTSVNRFENKSPDHAIITSEKTYPRIELEMSLLSWRNHFTCDIFAENGSAHIESLCKWGPTIFNHRTRVLPSGRPIENSETLIQNDPTWALEYEYFKQQCVQGVKTDLSKDYWLYTCLERLGREVH